MHKISVARERRLRRLVGDQGSPPASSAVVAVTSWTELRRDAVAADGDALLQPDAEPRTPWVTAQLADAEGPVIASSDWMRAVPDQISRWVPSDYTSLGTDGFGASDTRHALRRHFKVDAESIVVKVLTQLANYGEIERDVVRQAVEKYQIGDPQAAPPEERTDEPPAT